MRPPDDGLPSDEPWEKLLAWAEQRSEARRRDDAERKAREQAQREEEQAARRAAYLGSLIG